MGKYKPAWHDLTPALITPANILHPISDSIAHRYSINLFEQQHSSYNLRARSGDHQTAGNEHVRPVVGLPSRFACSLVAGDSGFGKRDALRLRSEHSDSLRDQRVGILTRPQAKMAELYRELGHPFSVALSPSNRWHSSKSLREKWLAHTEAVVYRPVLIIDQAQEMNSLVLSELRLLASADMHSRSILTIPLGAVEAPAPESFLLARFHPR